MTTAWACAHPPPEKVRIPPTIWDTEAEAEQQAARLKAAGIRGAVIYPIELED